MTDKITYDDVIEYTHLFTMVPSFVLEMMARKNSNFDDQKNKLDIILNSDIDELQFVMDEAYRKTGKKQFKILANPKYKDFIQHNLSEIKKLI